MPKKKKEKVEKKAEVKKDPRDAKIARLEKTVKTQREVISELCHSVNVQSDHQSHVKCHECSHFIKEAYDKAQKI